jgi:hypothetical protein
MDSFPRGADVKHCRYATHELMQRHSSSRLGWVVVPLITAAMFVTVVPMFDV